jgi:hypothetical protein
LRHDNDSNTTVRVRAATSSGRHLLPSLLADKTSTASRENSIFSVRKLFCEAVHMQDVAKVSIGLVRYGCDVLQVQPVARFTHAGNIKG